MRCRFDLSQVPAARIVTASAEPPSPPLFSYHDYLYYSISSATLVFQQKTDPGTGQELDRNWHGNWHGTGPELAQKTSSELAPKTGSGVSECDRVVSGPMLDQAIKRGFIAENKLNQVAAEFSLVHQLSPLGGLSLTSSPPVAPSVSKGVVWTL